MIPGVDTFCKTTKWTPIKIARWILISCKHRLKMRKYNVFQKEYLKIQAPVMTPNEIGIQFNDIDALIVGSDQVWNFDLPLVDDCYFGAFPNAPLKKYAYAASFGKESIAKDKTTKISKLLHDFRMISVREECGRVLAEKLSEKRVISLMDPTLLLASEVWQSIETPPRKTGYIFVYLREESEEIMTIAKRIAAQNGLRVISVLRGKLVGNVKKTIGPREWLGFIHYADMILTNSFHGICFSVIFHKNFRTFALEKDEWRKSSNTRLTSILELLGLQNTLMGMDDMVSSIPDLSEINYDEADRILVQERGKAFSYIKEIVKDIYG